MTLKCLYDSSITLIRKYEEAIKTQEEQIKFLEKADLAFCLSHAEFAYFDGQAIKGIGPGHQRKPDYLGYSSTCLLLGEWKSKFEPPSTPSWRVERKSDPENFTRIRQQVVEWEKSDLLKDIGGHIIIIEGQLTDYAGQIGKSYELPWPPSQIKLGYTVPLGQKNNVVVAFDEIASRLQKKYDFKTYEGELTVTFIF